MNDENQTGDESEFDEELNGRFAWFHEQSMSRINEIRQRLRNNDARLRVLETRSGDPNLRTWDGVVEDADLLIAAVASAEMIHAGHDVHSQLSEHMSKVMERFPGISQDTLDRMAHADHASKMGFINKLQGYLGEQVMNDLINSGDIPAPHGYHAVLSGTTNEPGVDFRLVDDHGHVLLGQYKVVDSASIVREHFLRYPHVGIVYANTEVAQQLAHDHAVTVVGLGQDIPMGAHHIVVDTGIHHDAIRNATADYVNHAGHVSPDHSMWKKLPLISLMLIVGTSLREYTYTDTPEQEIVSKAWRRLKDIAIARGAGEGAGMLLFHGDHTGLFASFYLLTANSYRIAKGNFVRSADLAHASRTYLSTF